MDKLDTTSEFKEVILWVIKIGVAIIAVNCLVQSCSLVNKKLGLKDDHFIEEMAEDYLEKETGLDIDFSPNSRE